VSPRFKSTALAPAAIFRTPSARIAYARSVEVVVPSPTASPVPFGCFPNHLGAQVLLRILELDFLGDGPSEFLLYQDGLSNPPPVLSMY
jgi:hypothetical protein